MIASPQILSSVVGTWVVEDSEVVLDGVALDLRDDGRIRPPHQVALGGRHLDRQLARGVAGSAISASLSDVSSHTAT